LPGDFLAVFPARLLLVTHQRTTIYHYNEASNLIRRTIRPTWVEMVSGRDGVCGGSFCSSSRCSGWFCCCRLLITLTN